jgi:hypothetical protein
MLTWRVEQRHLQASIFSLEDGRVHSAKAKEVLPEKHWNPQNKREAERCWGTNPVPDEEGSGPVGSASEDSGAL